MHQGNWTLSQYEQEVVRLGILIDNVVARMQMNPIMTDDIDSYLQHVDWEIEAEGLIEQREVLIKERDYLYSNK